jgi:hypothetical protein
MSRIIFHIAEAYPSLPDKGGIPTIPIVAVLAKIKLVCLKDETEKNNLLVILSFNDPWGV